MAGTTEARRSDRIRESGRHGHRLQRQNDLRGEPPLAAINIDSASQYGISRRINLILRVAEQSRNSYGLFLICFG
jgi:hypothetical protein